METEIQQKTSKLVKKDKNSGVTEGKSWTRYTLKFEDLIGSSFDTEMVDSMHEGETFKIDFKIKDKYNNIFGVEKVESSEIKPEVIPDNEVKKEVPQSVWDEKDRRIVRQNCNQRAIELLELMLKVDYEKLKELIKENGGLQNLTSLVAKNFEDSVFR